MSILKVQVAEAVGAPHPLSGITYYKSRKHLVASYKPMILTKVTVGEPAKDH